MTDGAAVEHHHTVHEVVGADHDVMWNLHRPQNP